MEAKWLASNSLPRAEEYLDNGKVSSGVHVVLVHLYFLLGLGGTKESEIHLNDISAHMSCVAAILRLWDDLGSAKVCPIYTGLGIYKGNYYLDMS